MCVCLCVCALHPHSVRLLSSTCVLNINEKLSADSVLVVDLALFFNDVLSSFFLFETLNQEPGDG